MNAMVNFHTVTRVRPPAVAGMFYPINPEQLLELLDELMEGEPLSCQPPKALILPHAGFIYSGVVAGTGYRLLGAGAGPVERVILLGPSHRLAFEGVAFSQHTAFATPLGEVPVDREAIEAIRDLPNVLESDAAHEREHSLEVHLPFLQTALRELRIVPLVVGDISASGLAQVLGRLWGAAETRIVISSDLSHYHDYRTARELDRKTADRIQALQPVTPEQACGAVAINGLLQVGRQRGLRMQLLDLRNSGDTAGSRDRVVGYGAFACN